MLILADQAIWGVPDLFSDLGDVRTFAGRDSLQPAACSPQPPLNADALLVRSVTPVNAALLAGCPVRFVGTASSGTEHIDTAWLASQGIAFADAAGCNARTVAEYVISALLVLAERRRFDLATRTVGVIGVGHVGSIVADWCRVLGCRVLLSDPPLRKRIESIPTFAQGGLPQASSRGSAAAGLQPAASSLQPPASSLQPPGYLLANSDIITLHVPLTRDGPDATWRMVGEKWLSACKHGAFLINTSRGDVVDEAALAAALASGKIAAAVLDVWQNEPNINRALIERVAIATPHVAGYSLEARRRAAEMIRAALVSHVAQNADVAQPPSAVGEVGQVEGRDLPHPRASGLTPFDLTYITPFDLPYDHSQGSARVPQDVNVAQNADVAQPPSAVGSQGRARVPQDVNVAQPPSAVSNANWSTLRRHVLPACDILEMDRSLRRGPAGPTFDELRARYADRREFTAHTISPEKAPEWTRSCLLHFGFLPA